MTDTRVPERWLSDRRVLRLSDRGYRLFITAMTWSVTNRSDGVIDADDLEMMPGRFGTSDMAELVTAELAAPRLTGWLLLDYEGTQTSKHELEVLQKVRDRERIKKAKQRAAASGKGGPPEGTVPGDVPGDVSQGTAQEGQDRQERQAVTGELATHNVFSLPASTDHSEAISETVRSLYEVER